MKNEKQVITSEANQIVDLLSELNTKIRMDESLSYLSENQYEQIVSGVKDLRLNIYNHKIFSDESTDRMDELTDIMTSIAALDFSKTADVSNEENHLDYIAIGLNLMSAQLKKSAALLRYYGDIIDQSKDLIIVMDAKGKIEYVNPVTAKKLGYTKDELISQPAAKIFQFEQFLKKTKSKKQNFVVKFNVQAGASFMASVFARIVNNSEQKQENIILYASHIGQFYEKIKAINQVVNFVCRTNDAEIEKNQYREMIKMIGEELKVMIS